MARRRLKSGFTTGTAASAAAKAAVFAYFGLEFAQVDVSLPEGGSIKVPVSLIIRNADKTCKATVIKDAGDDPDVTNKAHIAADVIIEPMDPGNGGLEILGGAGVGLVTKPGLPVEPGNPAINPTPRLMIARAVRQALAWTSPEKDFKVQVIISVERGEELAQRTLNPRLGVLGGISILGTTGLVKPFSHEAYTDTIDLGLAVARGEGLREVVLTTGGKSEKQAMVLRTDLPESAFVQIADFFGYALKACAKVRMETVGLVSFFGKAVKQAAGLEYTHAHKAVMDLDSLAIWLRRAGLDDNTGQAIAKANTARQALDLLRDAGRLDMVRVVGRRMLPSARTFAGPDIVVWAVIIDYDGSVLFDSRTREAA